MRYGLRDRQTCYKQCIVTLEKWEYVQCATLGAQRHTANWEKENSKNYEEGRKLGKIKPEQQASQSTVTAECGVATWLNQKWSQSVWDASSHKKHASTPDVGRNVEVRSIMKENGAAKIHFHQSKSNLILWVAYTIPDEFYQVKIIGWLPYKKAWELGDEVQYGEEISKTDKSIKQKFLYHPYHTEESINLVEDPTIEPFHEDPHVQCLCRQCKNMLSQVTLP